MHPIRRARQVHQLTITELALRSGVAARDLGAAELGMQPLCRADCERVAQALHLPVALFLPPVPKQTHWRAIGIALICCILLSLVILLSGPLFQAPAMPPAVHAAALIQPVELALPQPTTALQPTAVFEAAILPTAVATVIATSEPDPSPRACPLLAAADRILITQGYGEGTHAPTSMTGALDFGIDGDGDGYADPDATDGVVVLATQNGIARVFAESWPGGNVVRVLDQASGWNTLYAHLSTIAVTDGQEVRVGQPLGRVGSTGLSSGPHLHYEIWFAGENRDPRGYLVCGR
jgi:murein DD-endopeptidase MepM/ murein hydrolase activator NlpD